MADTIDYGHHKTGIRITGLVYSGVIFFIKFGVAIGGALAGWLLAFYGYQADTAQTEATQNGILLSFTLFPAIGSLMVAIIMTRYTLTTEKLDELQLKIRLNSDEQPQHDTLQPCTK